MPRRKEQVILVLSDVRGYYKGGERLRPGLHKHVDRFFSHKWTGFGVLFSKTGPATALDFPSTVGFLDRLDRKDRFCRVRDPQESFLDNPASRHARVGATNPTAGSGVNPKDPSWCSVLLRQVGGAPVRKGAERSRQE